MKLQYQTPDGRMSVELSGDSQKDLFKELATFQEVFQGTECSAMIDGKVVSSNKTVFRVREVDDNEYFEMVCLEPGPLFLYKKQFGQNKKGGGLFPKWPTKDDKDIVLGLNGWFKYVGGKKE
jgi:hypothetical protein